MDTLGKIVTGIALVLLAISVVIIVNVGIPALNQVKTISTSPIGSAAQPQATAGGINNVVPTASAVTQVAPLSGADPAVENLLNSSNFGLSADDSKLMNDGISNTLQAYSFNADYQVKVVALVTGGGMNATQTFVDVGGKLTLAGTTGSANFQIEAKGDVPATENGQITLGKLTPFQGELRAISPNAYMYPITGSDGQPHWVFFDVDKTLAQVSGLPPGVVPAIPGLGGEQGQSLGDLPGNVDLQQLLNQLASAPTGKYITMRRVGKESIEGIESTQFHIEVKVADMLNDPQIQQLLQTASGGQPVPALDPNQIKDIRFEADIYVGVDDERVHRFVLKLSLENAPVTNAGTTQSATFELSLDMTLRGFNQPYTITVPDGAVPLSLPQAVQQQPA